MFVSAQTGSVGTLSSDRLVIEPNMLFGIALPGPKGTYTPDRFSAVRVELRSGRPDVESTGPHELVWLVGRPGTPDVLLARTDDRAGLAGGGGGGGRAPIAGGGAGGAAEDPVLAGAQPNR